MDGFLDGFDFNGWSFGWISMDGFFGDFLDGWSFGGNFGWILGELLDGFQWISKDFT